MDAALKQRLLGAAVLIALAVIFVPMLLNGPDHKDGESVNLAIPPPPERQFETRVMPVDDAAVSVSAAPALDEDPDRVVAVETQPEARTDVRPEATNSPEVNAPETSAPPAPATVATPPASIPSPTAANAPEIAPDPKGRFVVGLGSYANASNAEALVAAMKKAGLPAHADTTTFEGKATQRVRLGPFADRASAERARLLAKGVRADVAASVQELTEQPQADDPPAAVASGKPGAWAVQVGAFKVETEANRLRDQLRGGGFTAFVERIGAGAETLYRVRIGPETDRANADRVRANVKTRFKVDGLVVAHP